MHARAIPHAAYTALDPMKRLSAKDALNMPLFKELSLTSTGMADNKHNDDGTITIERLASVLPLFNRDIWRVILKYLASVCKASVGKTTSGQSLSTDADNNK